MKRTIITLNNGLKIAAFSSRHDFLFDDGNRLEAVDKEIADKLNLQIEEHSISTFTSKRGVIIDIHRLVHKLTVPIKKEMNIWKKKHEANEVDIVIVPYPFILALKEHNYSLESIIKTPFRCVTFADRVHKVVNSNNFTI